MAEGHRGRRLRGQRRLGPARLNNPAINPYVIAVGAADPNGTYSAHDDVVPSWSSRGDGRTPDVVAPGKSIVSLRDPGSLVDLNYPAARCYGTRFFRGSGTSQAAAFVSGAAALLISQRPSIKPDQVKALLKKTARPLPGADPTAQGAGLINLKVARDTTTPSTGQSWTPSSGTGSLEAARGSAHLVSDGVELRGEQDIFGTPFSSSAWASAASAETAWSGGDWIGKPLDRWRLRRHELDLTDLGVDSLDPQLVARRCLDLGQLDAVELARRQLER